jgi:hypothetical protein
MVHAGVRFPRLALLAIPLAHWNLEVPIMFRLILGLIALVIVGLGALANSGSVTTREGCKAHAIEQGWSGYNWVGIARIVGPCSEAK